MLRFFLILLAFALTTAHSSVAQKKIKRNRQLQGVLDSTELKLVRNADVFSDFGWLKPDIRSQQIDIGSGSATVSNGSKTIEFSKENNTGIKLETNATTLVAQSEECDKCYYDISILKMKPVVTTQWVPVTTYQSQMVPVSKTRMVTRYQYNYSTKTSQAVYSSESYTAYESRSVPKTTYQYKSTTTYVLDIPKTTVYRFKNVFEEDDQLLVYEVGENEKSYYLQPISYVMATTDDKINYVFIDVDGNDSFLDDVDKVVFNTWNPYSKDSKFRAMPHFKENRWYPISELKNRYFIEFENVGDHAVFSTNRNNKFKDEKGYGKIKIPDVPEECVLEVNGRRFKKLEKDLKCQFGCYLFTIKRTGHLDFNQSVCVTKENPEITVAYAETSLGKEVKIENIFSTNFFVTVKGESGFESTYYNQKSFQVPNEKVFISLDNDGFVLEQEFKMDTITDLVINYEDKIKKILPQVEEGSDNKEKRKGADAKADTEETEIEKEGTEVEIKAKQDEE